MLVGSKNSYLTRIKMIDSVSNNFSAMASHGCGIDRIPQADEELTEKNAANDISFIIYYY